MQNKYPIYIISKGRYDTRLTSKALERMHIDYNIVIEPQEYDKYASVIDKRKILVLPFSNLGLGGIPARNWVWEHSIKQGAKRHWILDDNIRSFKRFHNNSKIECLSALPFCIVEDLADRYENVPMSGIQYLMFAPRRSGFKIPPFYLNTRVYSCILLSNKDEHRFMWRGRYNEDTDLALRFLKANYCTILVNAYLCEKAATMTMKGGNTDELYKHNAQFDGRLEMAKHLQRLHPDVTTITQKWGRYQHLVDYTPFKKNKLIPKKDIEHKEYKVELIHI